MMYANRKASCQKKNNVSELYCVIQGSAFNVTNFKSRITHLLYTAINTTEHGQVNQCLGFTKKPHVFNMSWRCPPWQSRHCCHLQGTLAMTRRSVSCVTFAISWQIAFLRLLISGRVWVKTWPFKYPHKKPLTKITALYILIFKLLDSNLEGKRLYFIIFHVFSRLPFEAAL